MQLHHHVVVVEVRSLMAREILEAEGVLAVGPDVFMPVGIGGADDEYLAIRRDQDRRVVTGRAGYGPSICIVL